MRCADRRARLRAAAGRGRAGPPARPRRGVGPPRTRAGRRVAARTPRTLRPRPGCRPRTGRRSSMVATDAMAVTQRLGLCRPARPARRSTRVGDFAGEHHLADTASTSTAMLWATRGSPVAARRPSSAARRRDARDTARRRSAPAVRELRAHAPDGELRLRRPRMGAARACRLRRPRRSPRGPGGRASARNARRIRRSPRVPASVDGHRGQEGSVRRPRTRRARAPIATSASRGGTTSGCTTTGVSSMFPSPASRRTCRPARTRGTPAPPRRKYPSWYS